MTSPRVLSLAVLLLAVLVVGCGGGKGSVTVKVTKGGAPLQLSQKGLVQVILHPVGGGSTAPGNPRGDGMTFDVSGADGKGIAPGEYKISITAPDPYPNGKDLLGGRFSPQKTTLSRDIKIGDTIEIDVEKQ
jgi:hypothetical protein